MAPGDGLCVTAEGACTLRAAVQEANALPGKQSIALPRDTYMLNLDNATVVAAFAGAEATPTEDAAASGDLDITDALDIIGLGADTTVLGANGQDRVNGVLNGATVTIRGVALTGGKPADAASSYGGGLRNVNGIVTLSNVNINANESLGGGGIANMGGSMRVIASAITGNNAGAGSGGGLLNQADLTLENVSVSGNRAGAGGGINNGDGSALRLANTIVVGNSAAFGPVCGYTFSSDGHNLFDNLADCTMLGETGSNIVDDAFSLQNMSLNAADTYAHLPIAGSRLIDAGRCDLAADQRGVTRPQGNGCDIGAIEFVAGDDSPAGPTTSTFTLFLPLANR